MGTKYSTRSGADVGVSVGDHGRGMGAMAAYPVAPPHQGMSPCFGELAWLVIQIFQKNRTKFLQLTSISREMHNLFTVPADQGLRLVGISAGLRREASLKN